MTREEIKGILPDITDEQLKSVLDINSADIGKAKRDYDTVSGQLATAKTTIKQLNDAKGDYDDIKRQLGEYQVAEQKRKNDELQAQKDAAIRSRFDKLHGERKYLNDFTQQGIFNEFKAALEKMRAWASPTPIFLRASSRTVKACLNRLIIPSIPPA